MDRRPKLACRILECGIICWDVLAQDEAARPRDAPGGGEGAMERDYFLSPEEARDFGLIDEVVTERPKEIASDNRSR